VPQDTRRRRGSGGPRRGGAGGRSRSGDKPAKKKLSNIKPLEPVLDPPEIESFTEFDLEPAIQEAIAGMGITKPTPIQALAIEPVLKGKDVIAKAETGTGKTLAFGAPMMSKIDPDRASVLGLVLSPTRELAEQVHDVLEELGKARGVKTALVVGGEPLGPQVKALQAGAQVVVGTPGRVLDLLNQRFLQFPWTEFAVLDEADKMLEIGFIDDVKKILDACNEYRRTLLFSATFPPPLLELARGYTTDPVEVATSSGVATVDTIKQYFLRSSEEDRPKNLAHLIEDSGEDDCFLVFCERRTDVDRLMRSMERRRFSVKALHGGYDQAARFRVMGAFRTGDVKCLIATDVASRGLDVKHVTHVVNLGVPRDVSDYTHRIGRTGRAGRTGVALTFVSRRDERGFKELLDQSGFDIEEIDRPRDLFRPKRKPRRDDDDDERGEREERRPRRKRREEAEGDSEERRPRARRRDRDDEPDERPRRRKRRDEDDAPREERPARRLGRERDENVDVSRARRRDRDAERDRDDERPARRRRERATEDEERPRRRRRQREDDRDEAPRARRGDADERPRRPRRERAERTSGETSDRGAESPAQRSSSKGPSEADAPEAGSPSPSGFGLGLESEKPRARRDRSGPDDDRGERSRAPKAAKSGGKGRSKRPKSGGDVENARPERPASRGGGFGQGI